MYGFAVQTILILFILSGIIAFIGNRIGRYFGKKRLSIFNLRPRDTATLFTVVSGILIMAVTFMTLILLSGNVRTALFGMEELQSSIAKTKADLSLAKIEYETSKKELENLQKEKKKLEKMRSELDKTISDQRSKTVVFSAGQPVYITLVNGGQDKEKTEFDLKKLLEIMDSEVKQYKIKNVEVDKSDFASTVAFIVNADSKVVLSMISTKNVVLGSDLPIRLEVALNRLVYKSGDEIASVNISGTLSQSAIEQQIKDLLDSARYIAKNKGVYPDITGSLGTIQYSDIYDAARRIKGYGTLTKVSIVAQGDIHTIGPLKIKINVEI